MKKYRVNLGWIEAKITEVEVERETEHNVWIGGFRYGKFTSDSNYFPTYEEAYAALLDKAQKKVSSLKYQLNQAEGLLGNIKGLKNKNG